MTDARATQVALEVWAAGRPAAQATQVALEAWVKTAPSAAITQIALEEWASVTTTPPPSASLARVMVMA